MDRWFATKRLLFRCGVLLLCAAFIGVSGTHAQSDSVPAEQLVIQQFIDDDDLSDEDFEKLLSEQGEIGEKLITLIDYVLAYQTGSNADFEDGTKLENVVNYHLIEFLVGRQQDKHQRRIAQLDRTYKIFEEDDPLPNLLEYLKTRRNKTKFDSDLRIGRHLKNLRYMNLYTNRGSEYAAWLRRAKRYQFKRELSFWQDRLDRQICDRSDIRNECVQKIKDALPQQGEFDWVALFYKALCPVNIVHDRRLYRFDLCEDDADGVHGIR